MTLEILERVFNRALQPMRMVRAWGDSEGDRDIVKVSVIGLGYVGSVAAAGLASAGHEVLGIDIDAEKCQAYRNGGVPIYEPGLAELISSASSRGNLRFLHIDQVAEPLGDVMVIATGTPANDTGALDLGQVRSALGWLKERQASGVVLMKSTVPPGTGERLREAELFGTAFTYISNPEFLREGQAVHDWFHPDRIVVGGADEDSLGIVKALYEGINAPYAATDITSAEMIKYASNAFLATKISFINEIAMLCERVGAAIDDVRDGVALDPRIGPSFLGAGVGYGGSCFPKDVSALDRLALTNNHNFELLKSVIMVNSRQRLLPLYALRERFASLSGVRVGILGLTFKPNTDDVRQAPSLGLVRALVEEGVQVSAFDPEGQSAARSMLPSSVRFARDALECAKGTQALVLMTEWPEIVDSDWEELARRTKAPRLLFDGRNALDPGRMRSYGFDYRGVGRGRTRSIKAQEWRAANGSGLFHRRGVGTALAKGGAGFGDQTKGDVLEG